MSEVWNCEVRTDEGKGASRRLRHAGNIPAIIYGAGKEPKSVTFTAKFVSRVLQDDAVYNTVLTVSVDGTEEPCIIKDMQRHPATGLVSHVDMQRATADTFIVKRIPFVFNGTEVAPGVKAGGLMSFMQNDVEIRCAATNLPSIISIDVSAMNAGDSKRLSDIELPTGVEIVALKHGNSDYDQSVVSIPKSRTEA